MTPSRFAGTTNRHPWVTLDQPGLKSCVRSRRDRPDHRALHSAAYFGPERDFWWNFVHLALIASRRALNGVRSVLDVGSGVGHWGRLLLSVLGPEASVIGVEWVEEATRQAVRVGLADRCR